VSRGSGYAAGSETIAAMALLGSAPVGTAIVRVFLLGYPNYDLE
jgi:hypothetical protein